MADIKSRRDLVVWNKAMDLSVQVYALADQFPSSEMYRLTQQITRAVASVPANIAEGHARSTPRDYSHFLAIAQGSLAETETFLMLAARLGYVTDDLATGPRVDHGGGQDAQHSAFAAERAMMGFHLVPNP